MQCSYSVPIIPQNLRTNETIVQIAEVLDHLSNITDDIFKRVNKRLELNTSRLNNISERVDVVTSKINKLKGAKKATQVFSSSKYPGTEVNNDYVSIFDVDNQIELKRHKVKQKSFNTSYESVKKLEFYHVKLSNNKNKLNVDGLGDMPVNVECVNDLLLYNSGKNLYKKFEMSDALTGPQHIKGDETLDVSDIGDAPYSLRERSSLNKSTVQPFFYTPKIGEVPELDVPLDLPDLPGIADNLRYENDIGPAIAPSALTPNITDLPAISSLEGTDEKDDIPEEILPPPPPPPEPIISKQAEAEVEVLPEPPLQVLQPPVLADNNEIDSAKPVVQPPPQQVDDPRASLMEAIRKAGGSKNAKLKTVNTENPIPSTNSQIPSGDLMADLHAKLSMRRKGISGSKKTENENSLDASTALGKISAMIPPPLKNDLSDSGNTEDEDWED